MSYYSNLQRYIYTTAYYLAVPALLFRLWWRSIRYNREYRDRWRQRFGIVPHINAEKVIWIHAVSMGETLAAVPLVKALLTQYPHYQIVMTATTPTGALQAAKHFGDKVLSLYTPYDLPGCVSRFLDRIHPDLGIILETELWPNLLAGCSKRRIPLMLANARLSERSCRGYSRIALLARQMVNSFTVVFAQGKRDGQRFLDLGLKPEKLQVTGNIKFDIQLPPDLLERGQALRQEWGGSRPVWVAASTHEGEETVLLEALKKIRLQFPNLLFVLVPRHPERFVKVGQMCTQLGFKTAIRSQRNPVSESTEILLGDTMGELMLFYAAADIALVGGSLVGVGGHNLIEPAILGVAVLTGPHLHNFVDISQLLLEAKAVKIINDADSISNAVLELLRNPVERSQTGQNGRQAVLANTGALNKHLNWIAAAI
jgi:3-deoxy-D-manno-octulosonic-acid transferase